MRPRLLPRPRDQHRRLKPGAVRAGRSSTGGCSRAAALQYQPRPRELGTLKVLLTATNGAPTSDRRAGAQRDRECQLVMRAAPNFSRSVWLPRGTLGERSSASWYSTTRHRIAIAHGAARELARPSAGRPRATRAQCGRFGPTSPLPRVGMGRRLSRPCQHGARAVGSREDLHGVKFNGARRALRASQIIYIV